MHEYKSILAIPVMMASSLACAGCDRVGDASARSDEKAAQKEKSDRKPEETEQPDEDTGGENLASLQLSPEAIEHAEIRVDPVQTGRLETSVEAPARVKYDVDRIAHVSPLVDGQVTEVKVSIGDSVDADQVVAEMRSVALGDARAAVRETTASLKVARKHFERQEKLRDKGIASERAFIEARGRLEEVRARRNTGSGRYRRRR